MQLLPGGGREDICVHWGLRAPLSTSSSALSERRAFRARRRLFSAQMKKKMIAARIAKSTAALSQYFSSGFDASLLMTSHWFEPLGTWGQRPTKYKTARPWTWAMWPPVIESASTQNAMTR